MSVFARTMSFRMTATRMTFGRLPAFLEALCEGCEVGIVTACGEGRHVGCIADRLPAAPDGATAALVAAVVGDLRDRSSQGRAVATDNVAPVTDSALVASR